MEETAGGAPRAQRDALKLLAVFVQHTDNKAAQQRLVCLDDKDETKGAASAKTSELDLRAPDDDGQRSRPDVRPVEPVQSRPRSAASTWSKWSASKIWKDAKLCIGDLPPSQTGSLENPTISEAGRKFLSDLLMQLTDAQLRAICSTSARVRGAHRGRSAARRRSTSGSSAFKKKRGEIASRTCPS